MATKIKEYWFGGLLALFIILFLLFVVVVAIAPHNDREMRGFSGCTYDMAVELNEVSAEKRFLAVMKVVGEGYLCYAGVMRDGVLLWLDGRQETPWANYFFDQDDSVEGEAISEELMNANLLDEEEEGENSFLLNDEIEIKENVDDEN